MGGRESECLLNLDPSHRSAYATCVLLTHDVNRPSDRHAVIMIGDCIMLLIYKELEFIINDHLPELMTVMMMMMMMMMELTSFSLHTSRWSNT